MSSKERMICPKCGHEQDKGESCLACGIIIEKFLQLKARVLDQQRSVLDGSTGPILSEPWYAELFDRQHTMLLIRVLVLLLLMAAFATCSFTMTQRKAPQSVITVESEQTDEKRKTMSDDRFKAHFDEIVPTLIANIDQCLRQCDNYLSSPWYLQGDDRPVSTRHRHVLTESMQREYSEIMAKKLKVKSMHQIPTPTPRYYGCYSKVKHLYNVYDKTYEYVENYEDYNYGFRDTLSSLHAEHNKLQEELNDCRRSF